MMGPTDLLGSILQGQNESQAEKMYSGRTRIVPAKLDLLSRAFHNVRFAPKADIADPEEHVRFVPKAD